MAGVLTPLQRRRQAIRMRKNEPRLERGKTRLKFRFAPDNILKRRAERQAIQRIRRRVAGQRGMKYQDLSYSDKMQIDALVRKRKNLVRIISKRLMPGVKKSESIRLQTVRTPKQKLNNSLFEQIDRGLLGAAEQAALALKSSQFDIDQAILEQVFWRGVSAWTNRIEMTPQQFAFNRVNSFIAGGKAAELDADLIEGNQFDTHPNKNTAMRAYRNHIRSAEENGHKVVKERTNGKGLTTELQHKATGKKTFVSISPKHSSKTEWDFWTGSLVNEARREDKERVKKMTPLQLKYYKQDREADARMHKNNRAIQQLHQNVLKKYVTANEEEYNLDESYAANVTYTKGTFSKISRVETKYPVTIKGQDKPRFDQIHAQVFGHSTHKKMKADGWKVDSVKISKVAKGSSAKHEVSDKPMYKMPKPAPQKKETEQPKQPSQKSTINVNVTTDGKKAKK